MAAVLYSVWEVVAVIIIQAVLSWMKIGEARRMEREQETRTKPDGQTSSYCTGGGEDELVILKPKELVDRMRWRDPLKTDTTQDTTGQRSSGGSQDRRNTYTACRAQRLDIAADFSRDGKAGTPFHI